MSKTKTVDKSTQIFIEMIDCTPYSQSSQPLRNSNLIIHQSKLTSRDISEHDKVRSSCVIEPRKCFQCTSNHFESGKINAILGSSNYEN